MRNPFRRSDPPTGQLSDEQVAELRDVARRRVVPGFSPLADVRADVVEHLAGEVGDADLLEREGSRIADAAWSARQAALRGTDGGDYDRLARAFAALEGDGVLARMCFTCCQTCGSTEIDDERTPLAEPGDGYRYQEWAYTFFHAQDAERLADRDPTLMLTFSAFRADPGADPADVAAGRAGDQAAMQRVIDHTDAVVGRAVVAALVEQGLTVAWNGTAGQRIGVAVPAWRKPLPA